MHNRKREKNLFVGCFLVDSRVRLNRKKKLWCQIGKRIKMGLSKVKRGCQIAKEKKSADKRKGCQTAKTKLKKIKACAHHSELDRDVHCLRVGRRHRSCRCLLPPFTLVLVAVVRAGARRCWLRSACRGLRLGVGLRGWVRGSRLGAGVVLLVGAWRRAAF